MLSLKIVIVSFCAASALEIKQAENQEAPGGTQRLQKIPEKRGVPSAFQAYPGEFFHKTAKNSSAMIFVINKDEHLEQCGCMQAQLGRHSPYQILRQTAVTQATHSHLCPKIPNKDEDDNNYCTNSLIAKKVKDMGHNKPDFVIIMQDTLLLQTKGAEHFWSHLSHFLNQANNEATCKKAWDHLAIDPHSDKPSKAPVQARKQLCQVAEVRDMHVTDHHLQVIRTSALGKFKYSQVHHDSLKANRAGHAWYPSLVRRKTSHLSLAKQGCNTTTVNDKKGATNFLTCPEVKRSSSGYLNWKEYKQEQPLTEVEHQKTSDGKKICLSRGCSNIASSWVPICAEFCMWSKHFRAQARALKIRANKK